MIRVRVEIREYDGGVTYVGDVEVEDGEAIRDAASRATEIALEDWEENPAQVADPEVVPEDAPDAYTP